MTREIVRADAEDQTVWSFFVDGAAVSYLRVWTATGEIDMIRTENGCGGEGYARALYEHAHSEFPGGIFHTLDDHRTESGRAFALAVGGPTIDSAAAHVPKLCNCNHCTTQRSQR